MERAWIDTKKIVEDERLLVLKRTLSDMLENNPRNISAKRNGMGLSAATFNKIPREELHWYPHTG